MTAALLEIDRLAVEIRRGATVTRPVRDVTLSVAPEEVVGLVGETGCGKTLTGLAVLGLLPSGSAASGSIRLAGRELLGLGERELRAVRGAEVAMIFQNPGTAFDPVRTIGAQIARVIRTHRRLPAGRARAAAADLLRAVELGDTDRVLSSYPHQLSGGMLQRCMIALALSCQPRLLIADEATSALDVTVARQIRRLLLRLRAEHGFGVLFVTHNLAEAYDLCDRVVVLYAGQVVESGPTQKVFEAPAHPYTRGLLGALPGSGHGPLTAIPGSVPTNVLTVRGCVYANRCPIVVPEVCGAAPPLVSVGEAHAAACHFAPVGVR